MIPNDHQFNNEKCVCSHCREQQLTRHVRVSRGAALLDDIAPGWWRNIDSRNIRSLDMSNNGGQHLAVLVLNSPEIHNQYEAMRVLFGWNCFDKREMNAYGMESLSVYETYDALTSAWMEVILRRYVESVEDNGQDQVDRASQ